MLFAEPFSQTATLGALRYRLENASTRLGMDFLPLVLPVATAAEADVQHSFLIPSSNHISDNLYYHWGLNE